VIQTGEDRYFFEVIAPYYIDHKVAGIMGINFDITEQKKNEELISIQSSALNAAANGIVITDAEGVVEWTNPAFTTMTGYSSEEALGRNISELSESGEHPREYYDELWRTISAGRAWTGELINRRKDGTLQEEEQTITPVVNDEGKIIRYIGIKQDIAERKKFEKSIIQKEQNIRSYLAASPYGIFIADENGKYQDVNPAGCRMLGYSEEEMLSIGIPDIIDADSKSVGLKHFHDLKEHGKADDEIKLKRKDGSIFFARIIAVKLPDGRGIGFTEDISEKKRTADELNRQHTRLETLISNLPGYVYRAKDSGNTSDLLYVSDGVTRLTGFSPADLYDSGLERFLNTIPEVDRKRCWDITHDAIRNKKRFEMEYPLVTKNGKWIWLWERGRGVFDTNGDYLYTEGYVFDITDRKLAERQTRTLQNQMKAFYDQSQVGIVLSDLNGKFQRVNSGFCNLLGFTEKELLTLSYKDITHPDDIERDNEMVRRMLQDGGGSFSMEKRYIDRNSSIVWVKIAVTLIRSHEDHPEYFAVIVEDITQRKVIETAVNNLAVTSGRSENGSTIDQITLNLADALSADCVFAGLVDPGGVTVTTISYVHHGKVAGNFTYRLPGSPCINVLKEGVIYHASDIVKLYPDDTALAAMGMESYLGTSLFNSQGKAIGILVAMSKKPLGTIPKFEMIHSLFAQRCSNEMERITAEAALHKSEEEYRFLVERSQDVVVRMNQRGVITYCSPAVSNLGGYDSDAVTGTSFRHFFVHSDQMVEGFRRMRSSIINEQPNRFEFEFKTASGGGLWVESVGKAVRYPDGTIELQTIIRDISERKRSEEVLMQYKEIISATSDSISLVDDQFRYLVVNDAYLLRMGKKREEIEGYTIADMMGKEHFEGTVRTNFERCLSGTDIHYQAWFNFAGVGRRFMDVQYSPYRNHSVNGVLISSRDITAVKQAQDSMVESENRFKAVWENSHDAMRLTNADGIIVMANDAYCEMMKRTKEELIGKMFTASYPAEFADDMANTYRTRFTQRNVIEYFERPITLWNTETLHIQASNKFLTLPENEVLLLSVFKDISSRVKAIQDLKISEERHRGVIESSIDGFWTVDLEGKILQVNDSYCSMTGFSRKELLSMSVADLEVLETETDVRRHIGSMLVSGKAKFESLHRTRSGGRINVEVSTVVLPEQNVVVAFISDITERKRMDKVLIDREEQYRTLITTMQQGVALHEIICSPDGTPEDYRFIDVNESFEQVTGLKKELLIGRTVLEVLPNTERYWIQQYGTVAKTGAPLYYENFSRELGKYFEVIAYRPREGHFATIVTDITERKLSDQKVIDSERQYRLLAENSTDVIWTMDLQGKFMYISPSVYRLRGFTVEEVMLQPLNEVICETSLPIVLDGLTRAAQFAERGEDIPHEYVLIEQPRKGGTTVWTEVTTRLMYDEKRNALGLLGVTRDITERKRNEDLLMTRLHLSEFANDHSVKELLRRILDEAEKITESTIGFFHFVEDDQRTISLQTWSTNTLEHMCHADGDGRHYSIDQAGVWVECVYTKSPVIHNDYAEMKNKKGLPEGHAPIIRELLIPILRNEKVVGIMGVGNKLYNYDPKDVEIASQLATMAWDILERRRAELALLGHEQALEGLSNAAISLLNMNEQNQDVMIWSALESLGNGLNVDRILIFEHSDKNADGIALASLKHEWVTNAYRSMIDDPKLQEVHFEAFMPRMFESLKKGRIFQGIVSTLEPQERTVLESRGVKSIIAVPIFIDSHHWGTLSVDSIAEERLWNKDEESILRVAAESIGVALHRMHAINDLYESEQMLKFALDASGDGIWTYTIPTNEVYFSQETKKLVGFENMSSENNLNFWLEHVHPEDQVEAMAAMERHLKGEAPIFVNEHRFLCGNGTYRWMLDRGKVLRWNKDGTPLQIFGTYSDIHHRKESEQKFLELNEQLEQKVEARTIQLRETVQELESFSYSISHDLRAPVRAIDSFSKILADDEEQRLSEEGKRQLKSIRANTSRMGRMIDDLLQFSRTSRAEIKKVNFDMNTIASKVLEESLQGEKQRSFSTVIHPMPQAIGDPSLLRQVLVNLISNAVKFTRHCETAVIEIGGETKDGNCIYFVKDNGTGFDMRYVDKLFGVFQRLHAQSEFEGTGVGLAIVNRILQKHAGRIWVDSAVNVGTTFFFSIPIDTE
jgi:PAS domain S-box-containing protein